MTFHTLNADTAYAAPASGFLNGHAATWRWSWHTRAHMLMLVLLIAMVIPYLGVWAWHNADFADTADAAGAVAHTSTTARWTAKAPTGNTKQDAFIRLTLASARQASLDTGWPVSLVEAQWANEHAWQLPDVYVQDGFDFGNSRVFDTAQGTCYGYGESPDGQYCYAATQAQGLKIWEHVAKLSFYDAVAPAAKSGGAKAAAQALGCSPWAASGYNNGNGPGSSLIAIMDDNNLYQFDK